jgi:hypothetical protein
MYVVVSVEGEQRISPTAGAKEREAKGTQSPSRPVSRCEKQTIGVILILITGASGAKKSEKAK